MSQELPELGIFTEEDLLLLKGYRSGILDCYQRARVFKNKIFAHTIQGKTFVIGEGRFKDRLCVVEGLSLGRNAQVTAHVDILKKGSRTESSGFRKKINLDDLVEWNKK